MLNFRGLTAFLSLFLFAHSEAIKFPNSRSFTVDNEVGNCSEASVAFCMAREAVHVMDSPDDFVIESGLSLIRLRPYEERTVGRESQGRGLMDLIDSYLGERYLQWDLSNLHPGLFMNVVPDKTGPYLGFSVDEQEADVRHLGTSHKILSRTLLPFLLGVKISLVSVVPLLIGALIFMAKKSLFLSKLGLLLGPGLLGFGFHHGRHQKHLHFQRGQPDNELYHDQHNVLYQPNVAGFERHN